MHRFSHSPIPPISYSFGYIRDQRILRLEIYPIQFNPAKKELRIYPNLKIEINYLRKKGVPLSLKQPEMASPFANVLKHTLLNYKPVTTSRLPHPAKRIGTVSYITDLKNPSNSADYLIITSPAYYNNPDVAKLANHRAEYNGFDVAVVKTDNIYTQFTESSGTLSIKAFVKYAYYNWSAPSMSDNHPGYILILGDGEEQYTSYVPSFPVREVIPIQTTEAVSDPWFVCVNDEGLHYNDWSPDIMIGRLPVENGTNATVIVNKIIQYEKNPLPGQWRNKTVLARGKDGADLGYIKDDLISAGFEVTMVSSYEGGTGGDVFKTINEGQVFAAYSGHGNPPGWGMGGGINVAFHAGMVNNLSNGDKLSIVFAASCETADFLYPGSPRTPDCIGEAFLNKEGGGGIAYWGASGVTGLGTDIYIAKAYRFMVENNPYTFCLGEMTLNFYLQYWLLSWNLLGDPALTTMRVVPEQGKAELEIQLTDIDFEPIFSKPSQLTKITAKIHNYGDISASNVLVKFFLGDPANGGVEIGSQTISSIASEGEEEVDIDWTPGVPIGAYKIYVLVDPNNIISERSKENNKAYKPIEVNIYQTGWPQSYPEMITYSPAVGDIDGDGYFRGYCYFSWEKGICLESSR
ncbi:MAG: C25 family cysteine peptidase [bacterium]